VETVDCKKASRFLVREIFSSASDAFSRTPRTISSGAFSTNYMKEKGKWLNMKIWISNKQVKGVTD
jgi:hypothetical protein